MNDVTSKVGLPVGLVICVGLHGCTDHDGDSTDTPAPSPLFAPSVSYPLSGVPRDAMAVDLDGDGRVDLAVLTGPDPRLDVLLSRPTGGFEALIPVSLGAAADVFAAGDLDGDARPDLAIADSNGGVSLVLNAGNGSFGGPSFHPLDGVPSTIVIADFDDDGIADIAAGAGGVTLLRGLGLGAFEPGENYPAAASPSALAVGDLDDDGALDVASTHLVDPFCGPGPLVSLLFGSGTGTLGAPEAHGEGKYATSIALADLDLDGALDVVVGQGLNPAPCEPPPGGGEEGNGECVGTARILLGVGDGTLEQEYCVPLGWDVRDLTVADLDGDGAPDLVAANGYINKVSVALGMGDGTFPEMVSYATGFGPTAIALASIDADADLDLAVAHFASEEVTVVDGLGDGSFAAAAAPTIGFGVWSAVAEDADADGLPDLIALGTTDGKNRKLGILSGRGNGRFEPTWIQDVESEGFHPFHLAAADLYGDQIQDLVVMGGSDLPGAWTILGGGSVPFHAPTELDLSEPIAGPFTMGELDGDSKPDLVAGEPALAVLLGADGPALLPGPPIPSAQRADSLGIGDLDADGVPDIAACNSESTLSVFPGLGDGSFSPAIPHPIESTCPPSSHRLALGDVNGDGFQDVALISSSDAFCSAELVLVLGSSGGLLGASDPAPAGAVAVTSAALADIDDDGRADLVLCDGFTSRLEVLSGRGDGSFGTPSGYFVGGFVDSLSIRDLDLDGDLDLVTVANGSVIVLGNFR